MATCWVYILANRTRTLYVGMTNDLERRVVDHKAGVASKYTKQYRVNQLVWYEEFPSPMQAIEAEKAIKGWTRAKKLALVTKRNPYWRDLSADFALSPPARL